MQQRFHVSHKRRRHRVLEVRLLCRERQYLLQGWAHYLGVSITSAEPTAVAAVASYGAATLAATVAGACAAAPRAAGSSVASAAAFARSCPAVVAIAAICAAAGNM